MESLNFLDSRPVFASTSDMPVSRSNSRPVMAGQTLAEVIVAHNGDPEQALTSFLAARDEKLAELVSSGQISQGQAGAWLGTMTENATARLSQAWSPNGQGFVDADGDGVCDYPGNGQRGGRMMGQRWQ